MIKSYEKNQEHFTGLSHVAKAISKDPTREVLHNIYVAGNGDIVATDGHRLHLYKPAECPLDPGFYRVIKATKTALELLKIDFGMDYPAYTRVIPEAGGMTAFKNNDTGGRFCEAIKNIAAVDGLNYKYFIDGTGHATEYSQKSDGCPVRFDSPELITIIMPMRLKS